MADEELLRKVAREACEMKDARHEQAEYVMQWFDEHPKEKKALERLFFERACYSEVTSQRAKIKTETKVGKLRRSERKPRGPVTSEGVSKAALGRFMMWLVGPKRLAFCAGPELLEHAKQLREQAQGKIKVARYYEWIASQIGSKLVRDTLTNTQLEEAWRRIEAGERPKDLMAA